MNKKHEILHKLARGAIERLKQLPQPVVRVSGPITNGGLGYEENLKRFIKAKKLLREKGLTVFDYFEEHNDEEVIQSLDLPWEEVMKYYHDPILASGLLQAVYMMPRWQESNGARWEHQHFVSNNLRVEEVPEEWLSE